MEPFARFLPSQAISISGMTDMKTRFLLSCLCCCLCIFPVVPYSYGTHSQVIFGNLAKSFCFLSLARLMEIVFECLPEAIGENLKPAVMRCL
jgi:hypothetical protein